MKMTDPEKIVAYFFDIKEIQVWPRQFSFDLNTCEVMQSCLLDFLKFEEDSQNSAGIEIAAKLS